MSRLALRLLDGGMGRELQRIGAPFRQPEWSALALIEAPVFVLEAHLSYVDAGVRILTSNSYALVPFHLGEERFAAQGLELAELAGRLARRAAQRGEKQVWVAGSLPPALHRQCRRGGRRGRSGWSKHSGFSLRERFFCWGDID